MAQQRSRLGRFKEACINKIALHSRPLLRACLAEGCGTAILVIIGCGLSAQIFLGNKGKQEFGTFVSASLGWGMAVGFGVVFAGVSGHGHVNPALSLAYGLVGRAPLSRAPWYMISQFIGAFFGGLVVYGVYAEKILAYATEFDNGTFSMASTGGIFVTSPSTTAVPAFIDLMTSSALLSAGILAICDGNGWRMANYVTPFYIAFWVFAILSGYALNAGGVLNPARDFGPRLVILICGWGTAAFSASNYYFWIPLVAPFLGAIIGAFLYEATIGIHYDRRDSPSPRENDFALQQPPAEARNLLP